MQRASTEQIVRGDLQGMKPLTSRSCVQSTTNGFAHYPDRPAAGSRSSYGFTARAQADGFIPRRRASRNGKRFFPAGELATGF